MIKELESILIKFSECGWDLIDSVSKQFLVNQSNKKALVAAITQANEQCGSCGCDLDPLYKKALILLK